MTPVEFAFAAFRFGHCQVRLAYRLNGTRPPQRPGLLPTDPAAPPEGRTSDRADRQIDWRPVRRRPGAEPSRGLRNLSRKIDPLIILRSSSSRSPGRRPRVERARVPQHGASDK